MKACLPALVFYALLPCMALMTACTNVGYNDNPSQQIKNDRVGCIASTEFFAMYFSLHLQPTDETQDAPLKREMFRTYCKDLPMPGRVFFTADLVGNELRAVPIGIRVVEQRFTGYDKRLTETYEDLQTIAEFDAQTYPEGVIELQFDLDKKGYYAIYLNRGGEDAISDYDTLQIPAHVGVDSAFTRTLTRFVTLAGIAWGLALIGRFGLRQLRRRQAH